MSNQLDSGHGHDPHDHGGASDQIAFGKVIAVGVVSLAIFAVATVWAGIILKRETEQLDKERGVAKGLVGHPAEIGIVDQVPFVSDHRLEAWQKEKADRLHSYGWVDRARGIAHIPIEKAMDMVADGASPPGAPK
jgi:hypothetical protein